MNKDILVEWNPWWRQKIKIDAVERDILKIVEPWFKRKEIIGFLGIRRSGKTVIMQLVMEKLISKTNPKNILFIKGDDERIEKEKLIDNCLKEYRELINPKGKIFIFIDEVQEINDWEKELKRIYDLENNIKIFVSGLNFSMLKEDLSYRLAGRIAYFEVYPFCFKEFLSTKIDLKNRIDILSKKDEIKHYLREHLEFGGFPEVVLEKNSKLKRQILGFYYDTIIFRDIIRRREIRNVAKIEKLINFYLQNIGNMVNYNKIGKLTQLSTDTVSEYSRYLREAFFIFTMPVFSHSIKTQEINPKKIYCVDTGIRNIKGFRFSEDYGKLMENHVFIELKRRFANGALTKLYYWKNEKQEEVDFVLKERTKIKQLIQVCYNIEDLETKDREIKALMKGSKELNCRNLLIITWEEENEIKQEGKTIKIVPLWKWLLAV